MKTVVQNNFKSSIILVVTIILFVIFSCKKSVVSQDGTSLEKAELQEWFKTNGLYLGNNKIITKDEEGLLNYGELDWDSYFSFENNQILFCEVQYKFSKKSELINIGSYNLNNKSQISIVFQKSESGEIIARIKRVIYGDVALTKKYGTNDFYKGVFFDDLSGGNKATWIYLSSKDNMPIKVYKGNTSLISRNSINSRSNFVDGKNCTVAVLPDYEYQCNGANFTGNYDITCGYVQSGYTVLSQCLLPVAEGGGQEIFQYIYYFGGLPGSKNPTFIIDNIDIRNKLDQYPCAKKILDSTTNLNDTLSNMLFSIFNINSDCNIKFVDDLALSGTKTDAYTSSSGAPGFFSSTIRMNPDILTNSYREYMAATFIHEAIHSYIDYHYSMYLKDEIDSNTFKTKFPIFWAQNPIQHLNANELQQHNEMAQRYIIAIKGFLFKYNPNISSEVADALAWGGLQKTTVWKTKSDTSNIMNININARSISNSQATTNVTLTKCQ